MEDKKPTPTITYYGAWPFRGEPATAVFRFFDDGIREAERFNVVEKRWVPDHALFARRLSGDLGPAEMLTEEQALQTIERIKAQDGTRR